MSSVIDRLYPTDNHFARPPGMASLPGERPGPPWQLRPRTPDIADALRGHQNAGDQEGLAGPVEQPVHAPP